MDTEPLHNPAEPGGSGGLAQPASRSHLQLIQRAIREDWPIPAELRQDVIAELGNIIHNSKSKRAKVAAIKALLASDAINVKREAMDQKADWWQFKADAPTPVEDNSVNVNVLINPDNKRAGFAAIRERLGIGPAGISVGNAEANGGVDHGSNGSAKSHPPDESGNAPNEPNLPPS